MKKQWENRQVLDEKHVQQVLKKGNNQNPYPKKNPQPGRKYSTNPQKGVLLAGDLLGKQRGSKRGGHNKKIRRKST